MGAVALFMLPLAMRSSSAAAAFAVLVVAAMGTFGAEGIMVRSWVEAVLKLLGSCVEALQIEAP